MSPIEEKVLDVLRDNVSPILAKSILTLSVSWARVDPARLRPGDERRLLAELEKGIRLYIREPNKRNECVARLKGLFGEQAVAPATSGVRKVMLQVSEESHIVGARGAGRDLSRDVGFSGAMQIKVATAISELARNIVQYAGQGEIVIAAIDGPKRGIEIVATDEGPGIDDIEAVMNGSFQSKRGMGIGLRGTKKLMDEFEIETEPGKGTTVTVRKYVI